MPDDSVRFTQAVQVTVNRFITTLNQYFDDHLDHMLGSICPEAQIWNTSDFTVQGAGRDRMLAEYRQALLSVVAHAIASGAVPRPAERALDRPTFGGWVISGARRYLPDALKDAGAASTFLDRRQDPPALGPASVDL